jgi:hypothetical protein
LIGLAFGSTGIICPSTTPYPPFAPSTHRGALSVTALTGSPIADTGIDVPTFSAVTSAAVISLFPSAAGNLLPGAGIASAPITKCGNATLATTNDNRILFLINHLVEKSNQINARS